MLRCVGKGRDCLLRGYVARPDCESYEDNPSRLFSHNFDEDALVALAVEFGVKNPLPGAEIELSIGHRNDDFVVNDQRLKMRVSVVFARLVMLVIMPERSQRIQPLVDIFDQATLVVVDVDSGSDVHGGDENHAVFDSRFLESALDLRRDVDVGAAGFGVEGQVFGVEFHALHLPHPGFGMIEVRALRSRVSLNKSC